MRPGRCSTRFLAILASCTLAACTPDDHRLSSLPPEAAAPGATEEAAGLPVSALLAAVRSGNALAVASAPALAPARGPACPVRRGSTVRDRQRGDARRAQRHRPAVRALCRRGAARSVGQRGGGRPHRRPRRAGRRRPRCAGVGGRVVRHRDGRAGRRGRGLGGGRDWRTGLGGNPRATRQRRPGGRRCAVQPGQVALGAYQFTFPFNRPPAFDWRHGRVCRRRRVGDHGDPIRRAVDRTVPRRAALRRIVERGRRADRTLPARLQRSARRWVATCAPHARQHKPRSRSSGSRARPWDGTASPGSWRRSDDSMRGRPRVSWRSASPGVRSLPPTWSRSTTTASGARSPPTHPPTHPLARRSSSPSPRPSPTTPVRTPVRAARRPPSSRPSCRGSGRGSRPRVPPAPRGHFRRVHPRLPPGLDQGRQVGRHVVANSLRRLTVPPTTYARWCPRWWSGGRATTSPPRRTRRRARGRRTPVHRRRDCAACVRIRRTADVRRRARDPGGIPGVLVVPATQLPVPNGVSHYELPAEATVDVEIVSNEIRHHQRTPVGTAIRVATVGINAPNVVGTTVASVRDNWVHDNRFGFIIEAGFPRLPARPPRRPPPPPPGPLATPPSSPPPPISRPGTSWGAPGANPAGLPPPLVLNGATIPNGRLTAYDASRTCP